MNKKQFGFSLIELSVVIVIIGFIIAAIVSGKNIIETARIRSVISEISDHQQSAYSFKLKYGKFPGDYNEAVEHWGAGTVNGNANGRIEFVQGTTIYEGYRAWQQLSYSKMTKAVYLGTETTGAAQLEVDVPESKLMGGYFFQYEFSDYAGTPNTLISNINVIALGRPLASTSRIVLGGAVTPTQGLAIDNKTDGGSPTTGNIVATDGSGSTAGSCVRDIGTAGPTPDDIYDITLTGFDCVIVIAFKQE